MMDEHIEEHKEAVSEKTGNAEKKKSSFFTFVRKTNWTMVLNPVYWIKAIHTHDWKGEWKSFLVSLNNGLLDLQNAGKTLVFTVVSALLLMFVVCIAVFFFTVKGQERVMVPDVTGKMLTDALLEMQAKELYPKIQLRYSEDPTDSYTILEQDPVPGSILKAGRRVTLVVSRGVVLDRVENYVGMNIEELRIQLQTLFAGMVSPLLVLAEPMYKSDAAAPGTILAQDPPEGTQITSPVQLNVVVSSGPDAKKVAVPDLVGKTFAEVYAIMQSTSLTFDFKGHIVRDGERVGTVTGQQAFDEPVVIRTRVSVDVALPADEQGNTVYGIFEDNVEQFPIAEEVSLQVISDNGSETTTLVTCKHSGSMISIPYAVPKGSTLIMNIMGKEHKRIVVQ
ncbi:MAG: PASTA domain-containing protein [Treponema sp.]|nr:PASTA domain-containing protein [Treponema sp.]